MKTNNLNPHILIVMKWLRNPDSVTQEELDANADDAYAAYATHTTDDAYAAYAAAADCDVYIATLSLGIPNVAEKWVNRYFKITKENKQDYIDALTDEENK